MSHLGKNYTGHPTVQVGTRLRCVRPGKLTDGNYYGLNDEAMADAHNINFFRYHTPGNFEVLSQPKRETRKKV